MISKWNHAKSKHISIYLLNTIDFLNRRTKKTKIEPGEVFYNGRLSWHGSGGKPDLPPSYANGKVSLFKYLSPSVESELLEELQASNDCNGRRGSLPTELILC